MKKILNIVSSPRGIASNSFQLSQALLDQLQYEYPGSVVRTVDLVNSPYPHLEEANVVSFFTPAEMQTEDQKQAVRRSDEAVAGVKESDILVISGPVYNLTINSALKAWIDHIVRAGLTFQYTEKGPEGLLTGKKVYLIMASGAVISDGSSGLPDYVEPYMRSILGFIGLTDITMLRVEGLAIPGIKETALEKAISAIAL